MNKFICRSVGFDGQLPVATNTFLKIFFGIVILFLCFSFSLSAQNFTPDYRTPKHLRDTVLMNTNHFYFGGELGFGFNLGPTATILPGTRMETNAAPFEIYDFSSTTPTKIYLGYAYKSHHFEGAVGLVREKLNVSIVDSLGSRVVDYNRSKTYATLTARYFYRFPIKIPRMKMMVGAEIGVGYHPNIFQSITNLTNTDTSYTFTASTLQIHNFQFMLGISGRMDIKIFKNLTLTLVSTIIGSPLRGTEYALNYSYPGSTNQTAQVFGSILNINLNAGLKFDFYSHKNKKATYDRLNIEDPFRDK